MPFFTQFSYPSVTPGTGGRRDPVRWADTINVMEFGAKGDGVTDDTVALQAAITYACRNGRHLRWPSPQYAYIISDKLSIPVGSVGTFRVTTPSPISQVSQNWAFIGEGRVTIQQQTDGKPIFYMAGAVNGDEFIGWRIENFRFQWLNNQLNPNQYNQYHVNAIEFDTQTPAGGDVGIFDFVIRNIETINGCRGIGINALVQLRTGFGLAVWGGLIEKVWHDNACSGAAIFLANSPEGQPNICINHVYHNRGTVGEESIICNNMDTVDISNVEVNLGSAPWIYFGACRNVTVRNVHVEAATFNNTASTATGSNALFTLHQTTAVVSGLTMQSNSLNVGFGNNQTVFGADASSLYLEGVQELQTSVIAGGLRYWTNFGTAHCQVGRINDIATAVCSLTAATEDFSSLSFSSQRVLTFYKNNVTNSWNGVVNDSPSLIIDELVDSTRWIAGLEMIMSSAVAAGTISVTVLKNSVPIDPTNLVVSLVTSQSYGKLFVTACKNANQPTYKLAPGDKIRVAFTTTSNFTGPTALRVNLICADLG